jgi:hypothetical protein
MGMLAGALAKVLVREEVVRIVKVSAGAGVKALIRETWSWRARVALPAITAVALLR